MSGVINSSGFVSNFFLTIKLYLSSRFSHLGTPCQGNFPALRYMIKYASDSKSSLLLCSFRLWELRLEKPTVPKKWFFFRSLMCRPVFWLIKKFARPKSIRQISWTHSAGKCWYFKSSDSVLRRRLRVFATERRMKFSGLMSRWITPLSWMDSRRQSYTSYKRSPELTIWSAISRMVIIENAFLFWPWVSSAKTVSIFLPSNSITRMF